MSACVCACVYVCVHVCVCMFLNICMFFLKPATTTKSTPRAQCISVVLASKPYVETVTGVRMQHSPCSAVPFACACDPSSFCTGAVMCRVIVKNNTMYSIAFKTCSSGSRRPASSSSSLLGQFNPMLNSCPLRRSEAGDAYSAPVRQSTGSQKRLVPYVRAYCSHPSFALHNIPLLHCTTSLFCIAQHASLVKNACMPIPTSAHTALHMCLH